ncbi:precorrin-4 C(11)-methyltransferase [Notoacmeibacter sp. MSK16QG-6]|uniref:precorrin-4 C(11)-methyltransferase n=1 Tax=Notoacmeibacter sp. MSK16QG-6 TaxID=2957982 RepID=UPI0020A0F576|nr:precorrin-4 C(11)-methyltransferase [Notoacmeibacter sp. MSK16QG-6]MCP1199793.1 precorrin-4 C(11)-methyltransferase [Notoacmeibacter sp. MSK16QG-6]
MTVYFIGAGPGAPDLITLRGKTLIERCPVCLYAGSIVPKDMLEWCPKNATIIDSAPMSLDEIEAAFVEAYKAGKDVARLHSGDLAMWSAVNEQIRRLRRLGIAYEMVPGVPAIAAAAASLGQELTVPGESQSLILTRINGRASPMPSGETLENFAESGAMLAIHLAIHALSEIVARLAPFYGADCPVRIVAHASRPEEKIINGTLADIEHRFAADPVERTAIILVGHALGSENHRESALYDAAYQRRFRGRPELDRQ